MNIVASVAYLLEFMLERLRRVRGGQRMRNVARDLGAPEQSVRNWPGAEVAGKLARIERRKRISPEQMEISRLRAEVARLRM